MWLESQPWDQGGPQLPMAKAVLSCPAFGSTKVNMKNPSPSATTRLLFLPIAESHSEGPLLSQALVKFNILAPPYPGILKNFGQGT